MKSRLCSLVAGACAIAAAGAVSLAAPPPSAHAADGCSAAQVVSDGGFESGGASWSSSSGVVTNSSSQSPHAGSYFAWLDGYGSAHTDTLSQQVSIPAGCTSAQLSFYLHVDTDESGSTAYDTLTATADGDTLHTWSNADADGGSGSGYRKQTFDLSSYAGQTVTLAFKGVEDAYVQTSFVIDDVALDVSDGGTTPPGGGDSTRTPAAPAYTVDLTSDSSGSHWDGHESVTFTNASADPLSEVYLRLWDNFHGNCPSTPITVGNVTGGTAAGLSVNCTAVKVTLPQALPQGESADIGFDLAIDVPSGADRFGHDGAFHFLGNALPVLAVHDGDGWHLDPYTNNGESFYSLAADFTVTLDHPTDLLVPATGTSVDTPGSAGRTVTKATADNVRDFAWAAGPFSKVSGTSPDGVRVNVYAVDDIGSSDARSMLNVAENAVDAHAARFGAYPYTELDAVLDNNYWFGGMEYPGFVLDLVSRTALTHEIGHQWWYGIVGDDEYNSPWLDESFTAYATDLALGDSGAGCWNNVSWSSSGEAITHSMGYWDTHSYRYSTVVYGYGSCTLHELQRTIGDAAMAQLMRDYAQQHRYGVSTTAEFKAAAETAAGRHLSTFWQQHRIEG